MERKKITFGLCISMMALMFMSCEKKEIPAKPFDRGQTRSTMIKMGENYSQQVYFSLKDNQIIKQNSKMDWDFALTCDQDPAIVLNTSRNMLASRTNYTALEDVKDTVGMKLEMDFPSGDKDSLSIGRKNRFDKVFIVWMGYGLEGEDLGYIKIKFNSLSERAVSFDYGKLTDTSFNSGRLETNDLFNHVFYSVTQHKEVEIEPLKTEYDLWFTQYLHFFLEPEITPYLVAGALMNPYRLEASKVIKDNFKEVNLADTLIFPLLKRPDVLGYDWKRFSLTENTYTIIPNFNYIIRTREGFYYRLKFTDFYDENGFRGAPGFVYELM